MSSPDTPLHQTNIVQALPAWCRQLPAHQAGALLNVLHKGYFDQRGQPSVWYADANPEQQAELQAAIATRDRSRQALGAALSGLQGITTFCEPLLSAALGITQPVTQAQYVFQPWTLVVDDDLLGLPLPDRLPNAVVRSKPQADGAPHKQNLLAAALGNFVDHAEAGPLSYLSDGPDSSTPLAGLDLPGFVSTCRALDLGSQYQEHLRSVFEGPQRSTIERLYTQVSRDELRLQAHIARLKGMLSASGHCMLLELCAGDGRAHYAGTPASVRWLELFGIPIHEVLLIGPQDATQINPCVLYIPGLEDDSLREFASLADVREYLITRLPKRKLRTLLIQHAPIPLQRELTRNLLAGLFEVLEDGSAKPLTKPTIAMASRELGEEVWARLYNDYLQRLKGNARAVAVPTADIDAEQRLERIEHWASIGMDVLNVAALMVPGLNVPMLALFGAQVMGEVFHGIESWEHAEYTEALAHVESLLVDALSIGAFEVAGKVVKASGFVDAMQQIVLEGKAKLWRPSLAGYDVEASARGLALPDAQGLYRQGDEHYVVIERKTYRVQADEQGQWSMTHPTNARAYNPRLHHDGQGGWRLDHEAAQQWSNQQRLRRIGHLVDGLDDEQLLTVAKLVDVKPNHLARTQALNTPAPALLVDALVRLRCAQDVEALINATRSATPLNAHLNYAPAELPNLPHWPEDVAVQVYQGSEPWGEAIIYGRHADTHQSNLAVTRSQLENGELAAVVIDQLDESSLLELLGAQTTPADRAHKLRTLLADNLQGRRGEIFDALYNHNQPPASAEADRMGQQFPALPIRVREEIVGGASVIERDQLRAVNGKIPLRILEEARHLQARLRLDRALMGLYRPDLANPDSQQLINALTVRRPDLQGDASAWLKVLSADRALARELLGQQPVRSGFRSPLRLSDGRIGYPLSGRGAWPWGDPAAARLRNLYPRLDTTQLRSLQTSLRALPGRLGDRITAMEAQWRALDGGLRDWAQALPEQHRRSREAFGASVRDAWRRESGHTLTVENMNLQTLPPLPAQLDHITDIVVDNAGVVHIHRAFVQSFPNLRRVRCLQNYDLDASSLFDALRSASRLESLDLRSNAMTELPANALSTLSGLRQLRQLSLRYNALALDNAQLRELTRLPLETLDLYGNRLTLDATTCIWFGDMIHLRTLDLGNNPLTEAPLLGLMARLESLNLSGTQLNQWPEGLTTLMNQRNFQLRYVDLSSNRIHALPDLDAILATPYAQAYRQAQRNLRWSFNQNALAAADALRLREIGLAVYEARSTQSSESENGALSWRAQGDAQQREQWDMLFAARENTPLEDILQRLTLSHEAHRDAQGLGGRVWNLLDRVIADNALRERILELAGEYPATCGDAGADAFSALELEVQAYALGQNAQTSGWELYLFYRRLHLRALVNEAADRISLRRQLRRNALIANVEDAALPGLDPDDNIDDGELRNYPVDDIEIRLALRQALSEESMLDFPEPSSGMLYRGAALVNEAIEQNVLERIEALGQQRLQEWIMAQPGWRLYLRHARASELRDFEASWGRGLNYLTGDYEPADGPLTDEVAAAIGTALGSAPYDAQGQLVPRTGNQALSAEAITAYTAERQHVEGALYLRLTQEQASPDAP